MSEYVQKGLLLFENGRYKEAAEAFQTSLRQGPDGYVSAMLALSLRNIGDLKGATRAANQALREEPSAGLSHYVMAIVLSARDRDQEALEVTREAIQLDPGDADFRALEAQCLLVLDEPRPALQAAQRALKLDPENVEARNLKGLILTRLGRHEQASEEIDATLALEPDSSSAHANNGWSQLHRREYKAALESFQEALRLEPDNDWARSGLVEALKARYWPYRIMLTYFLWLSQLSSGARWGVLLGIYFGLRFLGGLATQAPPAMAKVLIALTIAGWAFILSTWIVSPLMNILLCLTPYGRHAMMPRERRGAYGVGVALFVGAIFLVCGSQKLFPGANLMGFASCLLAVPIAGLSNTSGAKSSKIMLGIVLLLTALVLAGIITGLVSGNLNTDSPAQNLLYISIIGSGLSTWIVSFLPDD